MLSFLHVSHHFTRLASSCCAHWNCTVDQMFSQFLAIIFWICLVIPFYSGAFPVHQCRTILCIRNTVNSLQLALPVRWPSIQLLVVESPCGFSYCDVIINEHVFYTFSYTFSPNNVISPVISTCESLFLIHLTLSLILHSEQKRRLKAQKKAEEKAAKLAEASQNASNNTGAAAVNVEELDETVLFHNPDGNTNTSTLYDILHVSTSGRPALHLYCTAYRTLITDYLSTSDHSIIS